MIILNITAMSYSSGTIKTSVAFKLPDGLLFVFENLKGDLSEMHPEPLTDFVKVFGLRGSLEEVAIFGREQYGKIREPCKPSVRRTPIEGG